MTATTTQTNKSPTPKPQKTGVRRTQEDRSRSARKRLLDATIEVLLKRGYIGLTTKEVAKTAGMSNGALMHHYASKADLVVAATKAVYDEWIIRGQRLAHQPGAVNNPLEGFISDSVSIYFDWPYIAALELVMVARTDETVMEQVVAVMQHYRETTNALWLDIFCQAGYSAQNAETILNLTLNLIRGMGINRTWKRDDARYQTLLSEWVKIVERQFGPPQIPNA